MVRTLSLLVVLLSVGGLSSPAWANCEARCAKDVEGCSSRCRGAELCLERCQARSQRCFDSCDADNARQEARRRTKEDQPMCAGEDGRMRKCTDAEERKMKEALNKHLGKGLCKNKEGEVDICPGDEAKVEQALKRAEEDHSCQPGPDGRIICQKKKKAR